VAEEWRRQKNAPVKLKGCWEYSNVALPLTNIFLWPGDGPQSSNTRVLWKGELLLIDGPPRVQSSRLLDRGSLLIFTKLLAAPRTSKGCRICSFLSRRVVSGRGQPGLASCFSYKIRFLSNRFQCPRFLHTVPSWLSTPKPQKRTTEWYIHCQIHQLAYLSWDHL